MAAVLSWWRRHALLVVAPVAAVGVIAGLLVLIAHDRGNGTAATTSDPVILEVGSDQVHQSVFDARVNVALAAAEQGGSPLPGDAAYPAFLKSIRARVLQSLIIDTVIAQEARLRGVAATDAAVQKEISADTSIAGGPDQLATQLAAAGGSPAQLVDETRARLNEAQLEDLLARERAGQALAQIRAGQSFASVAAVYSDDDQSRAGGGNLGTLQLDQLRGGDSVFLATITALGPGQMTPMPVRDAAGYEILRVDAATATTRTVHRILVIAPQPYTVKERPNWFTQAVLLAVSQDCSAGQVRVFLSNAGQPCGTAGPTAGASASSTAPGATATAAAGASPSPSASPAG